MSLELSSESKSDDEDVDSLRSLSFALATARLNLLFITLSSSSWTDFFGVVALIGATVISCAPLKA